MTNLRLEVACLAIELGLRLLPVSYRRQFWRVVRVRTRKLGWDT